MADENNGEVESKQSKGGKARKKAMSPKERADGASKAANARWAAKATHDGPLDIGGMILDCAVLEDGTRVIAQGKLMEAMGIYYSGWLAKARTADEATADLPLHLPYKSLKPLFEKHLRALQFEPITYTTTSASTAKGIRAEILPKICEIWLDARSQGLLTGARQIEIASRAETLIRGFAHVGVLALIDEATGFQYERQREALQEALQEFLSDRLRRWVKTFPSAYFKHLCRLRSVTYRPDMKLPPYFGHLTNDIVYKRLLPGVKKALEDLNPKDGGRRKDKHHQWLSSDVGHPSLISHLGQVVGLMKISKDWDEFKRHLDVASPVYDDQPTLLDHLDDEGLGVVTPGR